MAGRAACPVFDGCSVCPKQVAITTTTYANVVPTRFIAAIPSEMKDWYEKYEKTK
jgi:hypothetical protein